MGAGERLNGQCLCGAVKFTATPVKMEMDVCHCSMCRQWSGGAFMAVNCGTSVEIEDEAALTTYSSSEWGERRFCSKCGSSLFWRGIHDGMTVVSMQAFAEPERFHFAEEIFIDNKPANYDFANDTHRMTGEEFLAALAAKQEAEHG
ncbi:aldehyde-activating protein [Ochrobactrum sp. POC9]|uniref:GFA family protein n=1 Tax=Ochrobactrum sp. POC9 TaxID=2203419 RepID=UPI000D70868C|nr:GFA family protein [Ochrobactrum sp. POC9]PWU73731.1 aldehyde-activating protein [Ochrobactrum sp. POC9]